MKFGRKCRVNEEKDNAMSCREDRKSLRGTRGTNSNKLERHSLLRTEKFIQAFTCFFSRSLPRASQAVEYKADFNLITERSFLRECKIENTHTSTHTPSLLQFLRDLVSRGGIFLKMHFQRYQYPRYYIFNHDYYARVYPAAYSLSKIKYYNLL